MSIEQLQDRHNKLMKARSKYSKRASPLVLSEKATTDYIGKRPARSVKSAKFKPVFNASWCKRRGELKLGAV